MNRDYKISQITWSLKRLEKMPFREIPYRLIQALQKRADKYFQPHSPLRISQKEITNPVWESLSNGLLQLKKLPDLLSQADKKALFSEAEDIIKHNFDIFRMLFIME